MEINLKKFLKNAPIGTKLYSTIYGDVKLKDASDYWIKFEVKGGGSQAVFVDGRHTNNYSGECTLFPSRTNRDWSTFKVNPLKSGDSVMVSDNGFYWTFGKYCHSNKVRCNINSNDLFPYRYIVPFDKFDLKNMNQNRKNSVI